MASKIVVFAEVRDGRFKKAALECLSEARKLKGELGGGDVTAVVVGGAQVSSLAPSLGAYGADRVLVASADWLERYDGEAYSKLVVAAVSAEKPDVVLIAASLDGKDLAPRVAALLGAGLAADVTAAKVEGGKLQITRPVYAGKAYATLEVKTTPQVISVRPNAFPAEQKTGTAQVSPLAISFKPEDLPSKVLEVKAAKTGKADLTEAERIVSGGRGLKGPENFKIIEELAEEIGATVGASRAVVDSGWRPHSDQVGQTGKTVSPNLYVAVGVSGAIQHLAGMSTSKCIVAINKDKDAPIFKVADYGIVGDLFEVVPRMTAEVRKLKGK
ncbi:electron transfer flavoprotein subunit alpha/FixB family protein [bacterium]|nr:electron transfer flavoprotein subunit alpha/FixB family protein [bacterium]